MTVLISQPIPQEGIALLRSHFPTLDVPSVKLSKNEIIHKIKGKDALLCSANDTIDKEIVSHADQLKIISNLAAGYDNIDLVEASRNSIFVTNTPDIVVNSVSEFVFAHLFSISRRVVESDKYVREGRFKQWSLDLFVGTELRGKTLGIIGFGKIGQSLVPMARGCGMNILYTNKSGALDLYKNNPDISYTDLDGLLRRSDYVVLLVPLSEETRHLITFSKMEIMKNSAYLINMARGPIVRETDLIKALQENQIAGACLDVYEFEPKISKELMSLPNTVLTPHIGTATKEARKLMSECAAQNIIDVLTNGTCPNIVNEELLKKYEK